MAAASAINILDFGTGSAVICRFNAFSLQSPHKVFKKGYHGKCVLSDRGKVCVRMRLR
jgi:hypothetical protein